MPLSKIGLQMQKDKPPLINRLKNGVGTGFGCLFQGGFICIILFFTFASCSKDAKKFLSCVGVTHPSKEKEVKIRDIEAKNEKDKRLVASLVKLAKAAGLDVNKIRVAIAVDQHINAMTVGTDTFVFCEGLEKLSDESLDAVMGHEVTHAIKDHSGRSTGLVNNVGKATKIIGGLLGNDSETTDEAASWAVNVAFAPYSKNQELEADAGSVELLKKAGYPINAVEVMCAALDSISKQESDTGGGFLSTHPAIPDRINALRMNSKNVTGRLTKEQYWAAMQTAINEYPSPFKSPKSEIDEKAMSANDAAKLKYLVDEDEKRLNVADGLITALNKIDPPTEYSHQHATFMLVMEEMRSALKHRWAAAKNQDVKAAAAAELEANAIGSRHRAFFEEFAAEGEKYQNKGK